MRKFVAVLVTVIACSATTASAEPGDPLIGLETPANGAQLQIPTGGVGFTYSCAPYHAYPNDPGSSYRYYYFRVATSPETGPDGRLATAFTLWQAQSFPVNAQETECRSAQALPASIADHPGTYYWQVFRICGDYNTQGLCPADDYSPVWSFTTLVPVPVPPQSNPSPTATVFLGRYEAIDTARHLLARKFGKRWKSGRSRRVTCTRVSSIRMSCHAAWKYGGYRYAVGLTIRETTTGYQYQFGRTTKRRA
jgi:hypothetical protein